MTSRKGIEISEGHWMVANWSLTKKLAGWGCVMALIVLALSVYYISRLAVIQGNSVQAHREAVIPLEYSAQFVMALTTLQSQVNQHIADSESQKMQEVEAEMEATLKAAAIFMRNLGSETDVEKVRKQWDSVILLLKDAVNQSKSFRKFEALSAINGGEGLHQILALNKGISDLLTQAVKRADDYQKASALLGARTRQYVIAASAAALFLSVFIGVLLARSIGRPLRVLSDVAAKISQGDLRVEIPIARRSDEIGALAETFRRMLTSLRDQSSEMLRVVVSLSSVASELSTTMAELVQSATNTSDALIRVKTTVAQVAQTSKLASDKAQYVVRICGQALEISDSGLDATHRTLERIDLIREQMQSIGHAVVRLSDQSQVIETIVGSVQDLADQSKLLAVNASIEAARAGDHGRGFAIVSQEIKTLADESKQATDQIRAILYDTRKSVGAVVMATEQGAKAVESGVEQSSLAGETIKSLVEGVANSDRVARVIGASTEELLAGMEHVSDSMGLIETAMRQNLNGTSEVNTAAEKLKELGKTLEELSKYYNL